MGYQIELQLPLCRISLSQTGMEVKKFCKQNYQPTGNIDVPLVQHFCQPLDKNE